MRHTQIRLGNELGQEPTHRHDGRHEAERGRDRLPVDQLRGRVGDGPRRVGLSEPEHDHDESVVFSEPRKGVMCSFGAAKSVLR